MPSNRHNFHFFSKTIHYTFASAISGSIGQLISPLLGLSSYAQAANPMIWACATGAIVLAVPYILLDTIVDAKLRIAYRQDRKFDVFMFHALKLVLEIGFYVGSAMLGAAMLGVATTPFGVCAAVGFALIGGLIKLGQTASAMQREADNLEESGQPASFARTPSFT